MSGGQRPLPCIDRWHKPMTWTRAWLAGGVHGHAQPDPALRPDDAVAGPDAVGPWLWAQEGRGSELPGWAVRGSVQWSNARRLSRWQTQRNKLNLGSRGLHYEMPKEGVRIDGI